MINELATVVITCFLVFVVGFFVGMGVSGHFWSKYVKKRYGNKGKYNLTMEALNAQIKWSDRLLYIVGIGWGLIFLILLIDMLMRLL